MRKFLKKQIADFGLLGFIGACFICILYSPVLLFIFLGGLVERFNDWTIEWFSSDSSDDG